MVFSVGDRRGLPHVKHIVDQTVGSQNVSVVVLSLVTVLNCSAGRDARGRGEGVWRIEVVICSAVLRWGGGVVKGDAKGEGVERRICLLRSEAVEGLD